MKTRRTDTTYGTAWLLPACRLTTLACPVSRLYLDIGSCACNTPLRVEVIICPNDSCIEKELRGAIASLVELSGVNGQKQQNKCHAA